MPERPRIRPAGGQAPSSSQRHSQGAGSVFGLSVFAAFFSLVIVYTAQAHGPRPQVIGLTISQAPGGGVHALTNNQGVFADLNFSYRWVCEDAIYPLAFTQGLALFGPFDERWVVATNHGVHVSVDSGCDFNAASGNVGRMRTAGQWRFRDSDLLITASAPDQPNTIYQALIEARPGRMPLRPLPACCIDAVVTGRGRSG